MPVKGFDHAAIPTADAERFLEYYKRLGFTFINEEKWRRGESKIFSLRVGEHNMVNVHPEGFTADLRGQTAEPGCGDLCFVWDGTVKRCRRCWPRPASSPCPGRSPATGAATEGLVPRPVSTLSTPTRTSSSSWSTTSSPLAALDAR